MRKGIRESDGKLVQIDEFTDELQASSAVPHAWRPRLGKSSGLRCGSGRGRGKGEGARGGWGVVIVMSVPPTSGTRVPKRGRRKQPQRSRSTLEPNC